MVRQYLDYYGKPHMIPEGRLPKWRISGYAVVPRKQTRCVLMIVSPWDKRFNLPGGEIVPDERMADGVIRECFEETGYRIELASQQPVHFLEQDFYVHSKKEFCHSLSCFFMAELVSDVQDASVINKTAVETERVEWVSIKDLTSENCHPMFVAFLRSLRPI